MTLLDLIRKAALRFPSRVALKDSSGELTYSQLIGLSDDVARGLLMRGISMGDRVGLLFENSTHYVVAYLGILGAGCVALPLNTDNTRKNLSYVLNQCGAKALIGRHRFIKKYDLWGLAEAEGLLIVSAGTGADCPAHDGRIITWDDLLGGPVKDLPTSSGNDLACILYTSGTTGRPKGVMLSHENLRANAESIISYLGLGDLDSILAVLPFFYSYGSSILHTHLAVGGTIHIENNFVYPNKALERMAREEVTGFAGVPSTFAMLLHRSNFKAMKWPHLRYVTQAGGPMPPAVARELKEALPDTDIFIMYGQTEATARLSYLPPELILKKAGSIGKAIPGVELRCVDRAGRPVMPGETGEICARGPNVMKGYWDMPEETEKVLRNGWLYTGDLATVDEDGFFYIVSRKSEMIKSGAHRISPKEIEEVISELPEIHEVAVIGMPDDILGESICAFVVPRGEGFDERKVLRYCRRNLASFKVPHRIIAVAGLPRTMSGKVKKFLLKEKNFTQPWTHKGP